MKEEQLLSNKYSSFYHLMHSINVTPQKKEKIKVKKIMFSMDDNSRSQIEWKWVARCLSPNSDTLMGNVKYEQGIDVLGEEIIRCFYKDIAQLLRADRCHIIKTNM